MTLDTPLTDLPGIGPAKEKALNKLGLHTIADLLGHFPRDYEDRHLYPNIASLPLGVPVCFQAMVAEPFRTSYVRRGMVLTKGRVVDDSGQVELTFFNLPYAGKGLYTGQTFTFYGVVSGEGRRRMMTHPEFHRPGEVEEEILPVYPLTAGVSGRLMVKLQRMASPCTELVQETLDADLRREYGLISAREAYRSIHFPEHWDALEKARQRLRFEELFCLSLGLTLLRGKREAQDAIPFLKQDLGPFLEALPFSLTEAQARCVRETAEDLGKSVPMNRLLQGDVGSGKTVVAAACAVLAFQNGCQAALMAPTELLAQQHFRTLTELLSGTSLRLGLLTGSLPAAQKRACQQALEDGEIDLVIGTHALLSGPVAFRRLGLVITDEQHRFGVNQRSALAAKSQGHPHVLVMSATPIPRTLALMIYGDLDLSVIDQLPPGRKPVETYLVGQDKRARLYNFIRKQVGMGRQAYLVCPAVSEEDPEGLKAAEQYGAELQERIFPDLRVGIVHGKQKPRDKQAVMEAFARGDVDLLVATTVIEVGVDVPNASLMVVEDADRFGLSQLHQLRGRVGRGGHQSYCVLVSGNRNPQTRQRLKALCASTDGFAIAEEDLKLRGPGDFFGARQHGLPQLKLASLAGDLELLHQAQRAAAAVLKGDPALSKAEHEALHRRLAELFRENGDIFN